jgi:cytochrome c553
MTGTTKWILWSALCAMPLAALASSQARQEYTEATRLAADPARGAALYDTCSACHGPRGDGVADGTVPAIAGQHRRVLIKQLVDFRHDRRWDVRMEHFADRHHLAGAQDIADVAAYVNELQRSRPASFGPGEEVRHGAGVYIRDCAACHGASGQGDGDKLVPRLAGQHFEYLVRQLHDATEGRRPNMLGEHERLLRRFDRQDINGVADYLSRLIPRRAAARAAGEGPGAAASEE